MKGTPLAVRARRPRSPKEISVMNRALALSFLVSFAGCGTPDESYDDVVTGLDDKADNTNSAKSILPGGAQHIYFTAPLNAYVSDDAPLSYSWFTAEKGGEITLAVTEDDGSGRGV